MADYPDYTSLMQIIGSDIMVPIDIQAAYIMMPIDIQAQYVTLDIDIVAQSVGNIAIDIAAQSAGAISVDITAQTIAQLDINIDAQNVGVYLQPEWAAKTGIDKNFAYSVSNVAGGSQGSGSYTVPSGKTLYICGMSFKISAYASANADLNQMGAMRIKNQTDGIELACIGGNGGGSVTFSKPHVIPANKEFWYIYEVNTNHNCDIRIATWGFEI